MIHVGIRPKGKVVPDRNDANFSYERLSNGAKRTWTNRMLNSGCNRTVISTKTLGDLQYCEHCEEYFSMDQFDE